MHRKGADLRGVGFGVLLMAAAIGAPRRDGGDAPQVVTLQFVARGPRGSVVGENVVVRLNALADVRRFEILERRRVAVP